jgi:uncharacterized protein (DUF1501 family)
MQDFTLSRRDLLRLSAAGVLAAPASGWFGALAAQAGAAARAGKKHKNCILLYMNGGASHIDTFDLKAGNGQFRPIATAVNGIQVSEHLPRLARQMGDVAVLRGMRTGEGSHRRANYLLHTGYREGAGGLVHPTLGSVASAVLGDRDSETPNFVTIQAGKKGNNDRLGNGYLEPVHAPLRVEDPARALENLRHAGSAAGFDHKTALLDEMERGFTGRKQAPAATAHREVYRAAARLMRSAKVKAFDLSAEPPAVRKTYGGSPFGEGCLLARRLVEVGVPFVEVDFGGWDTHKDNFNRVKTLSTQLDQGMSALLADLKGRGLLEGTLVVWVGDFGRTPQVKNGGRGHWPAAWTTLLCGGGLKTGQVVGRTDRRGATVEDRPVSGPDFLATVCKALGIDYTQQFTTRAGRPMRVVDKGAKPVGELFG